jgi:hypothetical protein
MSETHYKATLLKPGQWPNCDTAVRYTRLGGPGLDYRDLRAIDAQDLEVVLQALEEAYQAGKDAKAYEIRTALGAERIRHDPCR